MTNAELIEELDKLDPEADALMHFLWITARGARKNYHARVRSVLAGGLVSNMDTDK